MLRHTLRLTSPKSLSSPFSYALTTRPIHTTLTMSSSAAESSGKWESSIKRNPHGDFKTVEASRPPFPTNPESAHHYIQTPSPNWKHGSGANQLAPSSPPPHKLISPYEDGRSGGFNYKLLISAITPRPIAFVSTRSKDGSITNLATFSYFSVINHDPPLFTIGFAGNLDTPKDTLKLLQETEECVINIIGEDFIEAANSTSVNAPLGVSEWDVSGLTAVYDCVDVKCARVKEAVFSVECKLESLREFESKGSPGKKSGTLAIVEGTRFWVREDGINEEGSIVDPAVLKPVSRLGGITYGRTTELFELPRPDFEKDVGGREAVEKLRTEKGKGEKAD